MIVNNVFDIRSPPIFLKLENFIKTPQCYLKIEGLNVARSIKIKPATKIIESLEQQHGEGLKDKVIICSSSGNLAIAMSIICNVKGYSLLCISDVNINKVNKKLIKLYGSKLKIIKEKDKKGGYLAKRIEYIKNLLKTSEKYIWCNQYGNNANIEAHYETTAREIFKEIPNITHLFIGAGTTGTLMGCVKYFKKHSPKTKIIAVDAVGSVTFGKKSQELMNQPNNGWDKYAKNLTVHEFDADHQSIMKDKKHRKRMVKLIEDDMNAKIKAFKSGKKHKKIK